MRDLTKNEMSNERELYLEAESKLGIIICQRETIRISGARCARLHGAKTGFTVLGVCERG